MCVQVIWHPQCYVPHGSSPRLVAWRCYRARPSWRRALTMMTASAAVCCLVSTMAMTARAKKPRRATRRQHVREQQRGQSSTLVLSPPDAVTSSHIICALQSLALLLLLFCALLLVDSIQDGLEVHILVHLHHAQSRARVAPSIARNTLARPRRLLLTLYTILPVASSSVRVLSSTFSGERVVLSIVLLSTLITSLTAWCGVRQWGRAHCGLGHQPCMPAAALAAKHAHLLDPNILLVVALQHVGGGLVVGTNGRGAPAAIVAGRVALIELKAALRVPGWVEREPGSTE